MFVSRNLPPCAQTIKARLQSRLPVRLEMEHSGRAAVLIPILSHGQESAFLLTQRTHRVQTHKGQISFPGGLREATDENLLQTALRETWEEIGLQPQAISVLGEFDEYFSVTGLIVTPFVGWITEPLELVPNPEEVEEILRVPFTVFQDSRLLRIEKWIRSGAEQDVYFYDYQGKEVWGLTARIIRDFIQMLNGEG